MLLQSIQVSVNLMFRRKDSNEGQLFVYLASKCVQTESSISEQAQPSLLPKCFLCLRTLKVTPGCIVDYPSPALVFILSCFGRWYAYLLNPSVVVFYGQGKGGVSLRESSKLLTTETIVICENIHESWHKHQTSTFFSTLEGSLQFSLQLLHFTESFPLTSPKTTVSKRLIGSGFQLWEMPAHARLECLQTVLIFLGDNMTIGCKMP